MFVQHLLFWEKIPHLRGGFWLTSSKSIHSTWSDKCGSDFRLCWATVCDGCSFEIVWDIYCFRSPFTIPEIPLITPLIPSDIELVDIYSLLHEHESYMFREHTVVSIAVNNDTLIFREFFECCDDARFLRCCVFVICDSRDIDRRAYMFSLVFSCGSEVDDDEVRSSLIHFHPEIMGTDRYSIFCRIIFHVGIWLLFDKWESQSENNKCTDNPSKKGKKKMFHKK